MVILHAFQLTAQHNTGLLKFQSKFIVSHNPRLHLNMKCLTEPGDQCTQPTVSQLLASPLRNASLLFPRAAEVFVSRFLGYPVPRRNCSCARASNTETKVLGVQY